MRKRFGGYFISDYGKNRYFKFNGVIRQKAEAGVHQAYSRFVHSIKRAYQFIDFSDLNNNDVYPIKNIDMFDSHNPKLLATNILVPYILSALEEFFRSTFIALLRYSENKEKIIHDAKIQGAELVLVDQGILTVPEAVAKWMNFQEMDKVHLSFKRLDKNIDLHGVFKKPCGRKKENSWLLFKRIIELRHSIIHRAEMDVTYTPKKVGQDIKSIRKAILQFYEHLAELYEWNEIEDW